MEMIMLKQNSKQVNIQKQMVKITKCDICNQVLHNRAIFFQSAVNNNVICESCYKKFSKDDIKLMINLFNAYGGYFGKFQKLKDSVYKRLKELNGFKIRQENLSSADSSNLQLLHAALQFGFTPKEYFQGFIIKE
jgi:hypothetical protein